MSKSQDIRSFFPSKSTKKINTSNTSNTCSKPKQVISSNDEDIIPNTPKLKKTNKIKKKESQSKRQRIIVLSSESESENITPKKKHYEEPKNIPKAKTKHVSKIVRKPVKKKVISASAAFGDEPVKQKKVEIAKISLEMNIDDDDDLEKTLLALDEEELLKNYDNKSTATSATTPESISSWTSNGNDNKKNTLKKEEGVLPKTPRKEEGVLPKTPRKEEGALPKTPRNEGVLSKTPASKKRKRSDDSHNSSADTDFERFEKKRQSALLYQKYLQRGGPVNPGSKWLPKGKPKCLSGLCFIITGVLESLEREDAQTLIVEHGGHCSRNVSGKVNYMVFGEDGGPAKAEKARQLGVKIISEDDLIDLICVKSGIANENKKTDSVKEEENAYHAIPSISVTTKQENNHLKKRENDDDIIPSVSTKQEKISVTKEENDDDLIPSVTTKKEKKETPKVSVIKKPQVTHIIKRKNKVTNVNNLAWVDKYKPTEIREIIGQQGECSNVKKLLHWVKEWQMNRSREAKGKGAPKPSPWAKDDRGVYFRAALLSGPPGVGKTTTATLVCKELGFDTVEFNASDTRNKRMVHEEVAQILKSTSLAGYFADGSAPTRKHVLLMDEVDGMSGNEDRGGMQELISMIKITNIPIICMCNDRQHPKIRTLANYCFDLRFSKPRLEQIRGAMMSICFKEGLKLKPDAVSNVIQSSGMDIRQTINQLSLLNVNDTLDNESVDKQSKSARKDIKLGHWEVIRKVFSQEDHKTMSFSDKSKLFFYDYSIGPLFVQENYLKVIPHCPKERHLEMFAAAADAISLGDVIDTKIRSTQNWSLLETQAIYASVAPGFYLEGHFGGQIDFPGWLGKNSRAGKFKRMLGEIQAHTRMSISGDRTAVGLDYVRALRDSIATPMTQKGVDGVQDALGVMRAYNLIREDVTSITELSQWPKMPDPFNLIESKIKAAFTRKYNKEAPALPYAAPGSGAVKSKRAAASSTDLDDAYSEYAGEDAAEDESDKDDDIQTDAMIKAKNRVTSKPAGTSTAKGKVPAKLKAGKRAK